MKSQKLEPQPRGNNLVLIGFRCSGKNTIGEALARRLGWPVCDTDQRIQEICGQSIASLVEQEGWERFRTYESDVVREILPSRQQVVITGGGVVENPQNMEHLRASGVIVFLEADIDDILRRMQADGRTPETRPGLTDLPLADEVRLVLTRRDPLYRAAADLIVNTSRYEVEECVEQIVRFLVNQYFLP